MKFNIDAFKRFNKYVNTPEKVGLYTFYMLYKTEMYILA